MATAEQVTAKVEHIIAQLNRFAPLFRSHSDPSDAWETLCRLPQKLADQIQQCAREDRILRLAVVGQVKAGKSSFLNTLLFEGETLLPKAATPMTAALTLIRYGDTPSARIHYYSADDWAQIDAKAAEFDELVAQVRLEQLSAPPAPPQRGEAPNALARAEIIAQSRASESVRAACELVQQSRENWPLLQPKLGQIEVIDAQNRHDLMEKLHNFVGATGQFTPITAMVELEFPLDLLREMEVIDTPGINDPVISRGRRTKDYLSQCDVVFFLSYAGQFFDSADLRVLAQNLPSDGVKEIMVIGTKLDSVLVQESMRYQNIGDLLVNTEHHLQNHARDTLHRLIEQSSENSTERAALTHLKGHAKPVFVSSMAQNLANFGPRNEDEAFYLDQLNGLYPNFTFDSQTLGDLANFQPIHDRLTRISTDKTRILETRIADLIGASEITMQQAVQNLRQFAHYRHENLKNGDVAKLQSKLKELETRLRHGREGVTFIFERAVHKMRSDFSFLLTDMRGMRSEFESIQTKTESERHKETWTEEEPYERKRFFGLWTETGTRRVRRSEWVTTYYETAQVHDAIDNVERFVSSVERGAKNIASKIINLEDLQSKVREATRNLFDLSNPDLDVEHDILMPIERAVMQITVPDLDFGHRRYGQIVAARFSSSTVRDGGIGELRNTQRDALDAVLNDLRQLVEAKTQQIANHIQTIGQQFIDQLLQNIQRDQGGLHADLANRQAALDQYAALNHALTEIV